MLSVPLDTPPVMAVVDIVKVSLAVTLIVSLLLAVLSNVIPPVNASPPDPLSFNTLPFFSVIALAIVNALDPVKFNVPLMMTAPVPNAVLLDVTANVAPLFTVVVPVYEPLATDNVTMLLPFTVTLPAPVIDPPVDSVILPPLAFNITFFVLAVVMMPVKVNVPAFA